MIRTEDIKGITGGSVHGSEDEKIGSIGQVYLDNQSGQPAWVTVKTGLFGTKASFVPLAEATLDGKDLRVPYTKETVKHAPNVDADGELTPAEEDELYRYYDVDTAGDGHGHDGTAGHGHESSSPDHDRDTDAASATSGHRGQETADTEHAQHRQPEGEDGSRRANGREHDENSEGEKERGERRIRRYIVTEETVIRREEEIPSDEPPR